MVDINIKAQEFKQNAQLCDIPATRDLMNLYVTDGLKGDGTRKQDGSPAITAKEAACLKIPGSVDEPSNAITRWANGLNKSFHDAKAAIGTSLEDLKANAPSPTDLIKEGQRYRQEGIDQKIERAINGVSAPIR